jgi:chemotaxis family two-component system response regulator Rcp1
VEDNRADVHLIREAIRASHLNATIHVVRDGEQATDVFDAAERDNSLPCPDLVILDINLPKKSGSEVLDRMRRSRRCNNALVVVVSTSDSETDRASFTKLGVSEYFRKPLEYDEFLKLGDVIKRLFAPEP